MNSLFSIKNLNKEWYMSIQGSQRALTLDYIALSWARDEQNLVSNTYRPTLEE